MRILIAVPHDEDVGGVAYVVGHLARQLKSRGHEMFFVFPGKTIRPRQKVTKFGFPGFDLRMQRPFGERNPVVSLLAFLILFPVGFWQLVRLMVQYRIQVINVHYPTDCFFYLALCSRMFRLPLVTSIHGAELFPGGERAAQYSRGIRFLLASSDVIVAPSKRLQKDFANLFPNLAQTSRFVHNGLDLVELSAFRSERNPPPAPYILCVSAYKEQKAIDVLLRAYRKIRQRDSLTKLVLVGAGHLREELEQLAKSLGIEKQVEFLGRKERREVAKLLAGCAVFVLPSRFETFGIVILEAMAFGKPVVATTAGGIPEIIEDGQNGLLVEPDDADALADALITILSDRALGLRLASSGYRTVRERFRCEHTAAAYETIFAELLDLAGKRILQAA